VLQLKSQPNGLVGSSTTLISLTFKTHPPVMKLVPIYHVLHPKKKNHLYRIYLFVPYATLEILSDT